MRRFAKFDDFWDSNTVPIGPQGKMICRDGTGRTRTTPHATARTAAGGFRRTHSLRVIRQFRERASTGTELLTRASDCGPRCPLLAQSGHPKLHRTCPLLGVKQTWHFAGASDPKRLFAARLGAMQHVRRAATPIYQVRHQTLVRNIAIKSNDAEGGDA
jgi:hypothetical protein